MALFALSIFLRGLMHTIIGQNQASNPALAGLSEIRPAADQIGNQFVPFSISGRSRH